MLFIIQPHEGVDNIHFGEPREEIRKEFGEFKEFRKSSFSTNSTDFFNDEFFVYYNDEDKVEALEFSPVSIVVYDKYNLFMLTPDQVSELMDDNDKVVDETGITFPSRGIEIGVEGDDVVSVLIYK